MASTAALIGAELGTVRDVPNANSIFVMKGPASRCGYRVEPSLPENPTNHWYVKRAWVFDCVENGELLITKKNTILSKYLSHRKPSKKIKREAAKALLPPKLERQITRSPIVKTPDTHTYSKSTPPSIVRRHGMPLPDDDVEDFGDDEADVNESAKRRRLTFYDRMTLPTLVFNDSPRPKLFIESLTI